MKPGSMNLKQVYLVMALGVVAVSFSAILIRLAEAPVLVVSAFRVSLAVLIIAPLALLYPKTQKVSSRPKELVLTGASALCLALHFVFWIASLSYTSVASSVVLVTTSPVMVAFISHFLVKERIGKAVIAGIGLASIGTVILGWGDLRANVGELYGDLLAFLGAIAAAGYLVLGRQVRIKMPALSYLAFVYGGAALLLLTAMAITGESFSGYSTKTYGMLVLIALGPQLLGHSSLNWALGYLSATMVAIAVMAEPVGATILAWLLLDEAPKLTSVFGGVLIILGVYLALKAPAAAITSKAQEPSP